MTDPAPITLIAVPFDSGHYDTRMGAGPLHLLEHGVAARIGANGAHVDTRIVDVDATWRAEIATGFALAREIATQVGEAVAAGRFPLVLSGNCAASLGTVSGLTGAGGDDPELGVIWLDAHGDLNTPESTTTGFLDGMALAALLGRCWGGMTRTIPGFRVVPDERVLLVGMRDLDGGEQAMIDATPLASATAAAVRTHGLTEALLPGLASLRAAGVKRVYLHVDVDVHDPELAPANGFPAPDGLAPDEVQGLVLLVAELFTIAGAGISAYDPTYDADGRTRAVALGLAESIADLATR
jgi:arginase